MLGLIFVLKQCLKILYFWTEGGGPVPPPPKSATGTSFLYHCVENNKTSL